MNKLVTGGLLVAGGLAIIGLSVASVEKHSKNKETENFDSAEEVIVDTTCREA